MYSTELKIKRLSLAAEARLIRQEERRMKAKRRTDMVDRLHLHRTSDVRGASRAAHLAHTYLTAKPYAVAENPALRRSDPPVAGVVENLRRFGGGQIKGMDKADLQRAVGAWIDGGAPVGAAASNPAVCEGSTPRAAPLPR